MQALNIVELSMGLELSDERRTAIVIAVQSQEYTRAQVMLAARDLCSDTELDEKLRYGGAFTAADFKRVIESDESNANLGKLYGYWEARAYWERLGAPGTFPDSLFRTVNDNGETKYRLK